MGRRMKQPWLLHLEADGWCIVPPPDVAEPTNRHEFSPESLGEQADAVRTQLDLLGWRGEPLAIGLSASLCLAATVTVPTPSMLRKRQAMRFHLEGWIPWPAEEFVADYVPHQTLALMVAVRCQPLKGFLEGLEQRDASPTSIIPTAFLALDGYSGSEKSPASYTLLWRHDDEVELFVVSDGAPRIWRHAQVRSANDLLQIASLDQLEQEDQSAWLTRGLESHELNILADHGIDVKPVEGPAWDEAIRASVDAITAGDREPLIDLRRDELAGQRPAQALGREIGRLKVAVVLAAFAVCEALWIRGDQYAKSSIDLQRQTVAVFEETFPKEPPPELPLSAIRKAHTLLQGTRGPAKELPAGPSCDQLLEQVLAALPDDLRYRVPEIRLEGSSVYVGGEVRSNADADRIAAAIRAAGFEVTSPRTQRLAEQGFAVRLAGQLPSDRLRKDVK